MPYHPSIPSIIDRVADNQMALAVEGRTSQLYFSLHADIKKNRRLVAIRFPGPLYAHFLALVIDLFRILAFHDLLVAARTVLLLRAGRLLQLLLSELLLNRIRKRNFLRLLLGFRIRSHLF